jgi:hypothetical protein
MFISLRESRMSGFKRWSDLQQQKYGTERATNRNDRLPRPVFDVVMTAARPAQRPGDPAAVTLVDAGRPPKRRF